MRPNQDHSNATQTPPKPNTTTPRTQTMTHSVKTVMKTPLFLLAAMLAAGSAHAQGATSSLSTVSESSIGLSLIGYKYDEPNVMTLKARKVGIDYSGTHAFNPQWPRSGQGWFVRGELQYAVGDADYSSPISGNLNGTENWYYEVRAHLGRDFQMKGYVLAPYFGLGFRHLYNDLRGVTSNGSIGYIRENDLKTASIGFTHRMNLSQGARLSTTFEYMHLLEGTQRSIGYPALGDVENKQNNGHGIRLSSMWRVNQWSFGPTLTYWNIKDSEVVRNLVEPKNKTTELGFKSNFHF
jgi:hypothetical protein